MGINCNSVTIYRKSGYQPMFRKSRGFIFDEEDFIVTSPKDAKEYWTECLLHKLNVHKDKES